MDDEPSTSKETNEQLQQDFASSSKSSGDIHSSQSVWRINSSSGVQPIPPFSIKKSGLEVTSPSLRSTYFGVETTPSLATIESSFEVTSPSFSSTKFAVQTTPLFSMTEPGFKIVSSSLSSTNLGVQTTPPVSMIKSSFQGTSPSFTSTNGVKSTPSFPVIEPSIEIQSVYSSYLIAPSSLEVLPSPSFSITNCSGKTMANIIGEFEGEKLKVYLDTKGLKSVGIGFNMEQTDARKIWKKYLPSVSFDDVLNGKLNLTDAEAMKLFEHTLKEEIATAKRLFPNFNKYPKCVKIALVNGVFRGEFKKEHKTVKHINSGEWDKVADEYLDHNDYRNSKPGRNGGIKTRMDYNAKIFREYAKELKKE